MEFNLIYLFLKQLFLRNIIKKPGIKPGIKKVIPKINMRRDYRCPGKQLRRLQLRGIADTQIHRRKCSKFCHQ